MIGQDRAKKVLSVAVYNHYKRIYTNIPTASNTSNSGVQQKANELMIADSSRMLQSTLGNKGMQHGEPSFTLYIMQILLIHIACKSAQFLLAKHDFITLGIGVDSPTDDPM